MTETHVTVGGEPGVAQQIPMSQGPCTLEAAVSVGWDCSLTGRLVRGRTLSEFTHVIVKRTLFFSSWEEALGSLLAISRNLCQFLPSGSLCWAAADHSQSQRETASEGPRGKQDGRVAIAFAAFFPLELKF